MTDFGAEFGYSEDKPEAQWHVVATKMGQSVEVAKRLKFLNGFSPLYEIQVVTKRLEKIKKAIPVFPRCTFACWPGDDPYLWHHIKGVEGVTGILGGATPGVVSTVEMEKLLSRADPNWVIPDLAAVIASARLGIGLVVVIQQGAWAGHRGIVDSFDDKKLLVGVKITLLGRPLVIAVPPSWCEVVPGEPEVLALETRPLSKNSHPRGRRRQFERRSR